MRSLQERYDSMESQAKLFEREYIKERDKLIEREEDISVALYELGKLEELLEMPERGYVRNCWNSALRTLKEGFGK